MKRFGIALTSVVVASLPLVASAHEVYVLSKEEVVQGIAMPPFSLWDTAMQNLTSFALWACVGIVLVVGVFLFSVSRFLENHCDPFLMRLKRYGPSIVRITIGLSFFAAAYYGAIFGPELPLAVTFGAAAPLVRGLLVIIGVAFCSGIAVRPAAFAALVLFLITAWEDGTYLLTYTNYLGEILLLLVLGESVGRVKGRRRSLFFRFAEAIRPYRFFILRAAFATSLIYASLYAKVFHNALALEVAELPLGHVHNLAYHFGMDPHFLVFGAAIVEVLLGLFFLFGIEIRFTALFMEFWLTLSLFYFGEAVWPHLILIGIPIALICHGYDRYSIEGWRFKKGRVEPVL